MRVQTAQLDDIHPAALVDRPTELVLVFREGLLDPETVEYLSILLDRV